MPQTQDTHYKPLRYVHTRKKKIFTALKLIFVTTIKAPKLKFNLRASLYASLNELNVIRPKHFTLEGTGKRVEFTRANNIN